MKTSKMMAMALTVVMASQMMAPMAFGAEVEVGLDFVDVTEDVSGDGFVFDYEAEGATLTITENLTIADVNTGIKLPANATLVVEEDVKLTIGAESFGIYAEGDMNLVIDGDMTIVVDAEGATIEDPLYGILASGTTDADGNYNGNGRLTILATGEVSVIARDGIYSSGDMNITGGNWKMEAYIALSSNTNDITLQDGIWNITGVTGIAAYGGNATIENCEYYADTTFSAVSVSEGVMTIGDDCLMVSGGTFVSKDIAISESSEIHAMVSCVTEGEDLEERPWTVMIYGDMVYTNTTGENAFYNDHFVFVEGASLTIAEDAMFSLAPDADKEGDMGSTIDTTGGTIINNGTLVFKEGTTEEEIAAMNIQGDGAVGVMSAEEELYSLPYTDVSESNWFYDSVYFVTGFGLMEGVSEVEFAPTAAATYAVFVEAMSTFNDDVVLPENADEAMTREAMVNILYVCMGEPEVEGDLSQFVDGEDVSEDTKDAMVWAVSEGLISGNANGTLDAEGDATRAQVANILLRVMQQIMAE